MRLSDPVIPEADRGIARAEADRLLLWWNRLVDRADKDLAAAEIGQCVYHVRVQRERRLVFGNRLLESTPHAQRQSSGKMGKRVARGRRQGAQSHRLYLLVVAVGCVGPEDH